MTRLTALLDMAPTLARSTLGGMPPVPVPVWQRSFSGDGWRIDYAEYLPPRHLRGPVVCFWHGRTTGRPEGVTELVLPDACVDVLFCRPGFLTVVGFMTAPIAGPARAGETLAVRFQPQVLGTLINDSPRLLLGQSLRDDAWPRNRQAVDLAQALWERPDLGGRLALLAAWVETVLAGHRPDPRIQAAMALLLEDPNRGMRDLARVLGHSERHLTRCFSDRVGPGPKTLAQHLRFIACVERLAAGGSQVAAALEAGYCDQPHACRAIRGLSGRSPLALTRLLAGDQACPICTIPRLRHLQPGT